MPPIPILGPVTTEDALRALVERLQQFAPPHCRLLFRGQTRLHPTVRSGRARPDIGNVPQAVHDGWHSLVGRILSTEGRQAAGLAAREAVLQHYGQPTYFLDLTGDASVAAWFGINKYTVPSLRLYYGARRVSRVTYASLRQGRGYVLVLCIPHADDLIASETLIKLAGLVPFLRPERQDAWLLLDRPPLLPDATAFWRWTIAIDCATFVSSHTQRVLFPPPVEDEGYNGLLSVPYVQFPFALFQPTPDRRADATDEMHAADLRSWQHLYFARRAIDIAEIITDDGSPTAVDHKWHDTTLFEPVAVRLWRQWHFDLSSIHPGAFGDIASAAKITVAPWAWEQMVGAVGNVPAEWPELPTNDIFLSLAAIDHDKVIDHGPPYHGTWLHRQDDLIIEQGTISDDATLGITAGHAFLLRNGRLSPQEIAAACRCGSPESHERTVTASLTLSALVRTGALALLPHPSWVPGWYVLI